MSYTITPPMRSRPMKASRCAPMTPTARPSGSGPLLSLRLSKVFASLSALKFAGSAAAVMRSKSSPESKICSPVDL
jgi:hypothetical protein